MFKTLKTGRRLLPLLAFGPFMMKTYKNDFKRIHEGKVEVELPHFERRTLYPQNKPYNTGYLKVSDIHTIYFEECGNPNGKPVVVLHGGPGGGMNEAMR